MAIQNEYARHQRPGFYGDVSRPVPPSVFDLGQVSVAVKPGSGVLYDATADKWRLPTTNAERLDVTGIVSFDSAVVANRDGVIEYPVDTIIKVGVMGHFYAQAGEVLEYGDLVVFDQVAGDWIKYTRTVEDFSGTVDASAISDYVRDAINTLPKAPIIAVSDAVAGGLVDLRLSGALVR